jgi:hypothetical protein
MDAPSAVLLAVIRYSLLEVGLENMVEVCTSSFVEDDAKFFDVLLSAIPLDEEDTNAESVLEVLTAAPGSEITVMDDAETSVSVGLVTEIELLDRGVFAKELDDERSVDCVDTLSVGTDCEVSTTTTVSTAEPATFPM